MKSGSDNNPSEYTERLAKLVQRTLFRSRCPKCRFADITVRYLPYEEVSGDFYDIALIETGQNAFLIRTRKKDVS